MHKSLIEHAKDYLATCDKPQEIYTIFDEVRKLAGYSEEEFASKKAQFYTDFTLCSNFIYCGKNEWDLKERQPGELFDCDSSFFIDPKERKRIIEERKKESAAATVIEDNIDSVSGYEGVEEYVEDTGKDDSYDDPTDTYFVEDDFEEDYDDDDEDEYDDIMNQYEDLYDEE